LKVLTTGRDGTARLWDLASGSETMRFLGHSDWVYTGVFSPDGSRILTASGDSTAREWDIRSGEELRQWTGHGKWVRSASYSPDGREILTASEDGTARVWDAETSVQMARFFHSSDAGISTTSAGEEFRGEFYCVKCKERRIADGQVVVTNARRIAKALCPVCGARLNRILQESSGR
jgi:WD40 repeat protein